MSKQLLDAMLRRAVTLHGTAIRPNATTGLPETVPAEKAVTDFITMLASEIPNERDQAEALIKAWRNPEELRNLSALRIEQIGNFITAQAMWASMFFEQVQLAENEEPYFENGTKQEVRVNYVGEDGTPERVKVVRPGSRVGVALRFITTEVVRYKTLDVYKGRIADVARKQFDISLDLRLQKDKSHFDLLQASLANGGAYGAFSYEQGRTAKEKRIYLAHSIVDTDRLPSTNAWDLTSDDYGLGYTTDRFGVKVLQAVEHYAALWADMLPDAGGTKLVPTGEIIVPSNQLIKIATDALPTSNTATGDVQKQVLDNGYLELRFLGRLWRFIPDSTYCPTNYCYPRFNLLPGKTFTKPSMDQDFTVPNEREHWEERSAQVVFGAHIVSQHRPRALRIKFA